MSHSPVPLKARKMPLELLSEGVPTVIVTLKFQSRKSVVFVVIQLHVYYIFHVNVEHLYIYMICQ